jgi:hypothetical protein
MRAANTVPITTPAFTHPYRKDTPFVQKRIGCAKLETIVVFFRRDIDDAVATARADGYIGQGAGWMPPVECGATLPGQDTEFVGMEGASGRKGFYPT